MFATEIEVGNLDGNWEEPNGQPIPEEVGNELDQLRGCTGEDEYTVIRVRFSGHSETEIVSGHVFHSQEVTDDVRVSVDFCGTVVPILSGFSWVREWALEQLQDQMRDRIAVSGDMSSRVIA